MIPVTLPGGDIITLLPVCNQLRFPCIPLPPLWPTLSFHISGPHHKSINFGLGKVNTIPVGALKQACCVNPPGAGDMGSQPTIPAIPSTAGCLPMPGH